MPRLLDNRIVGGAIDVFNRTPDSLVPGNVLTVLGDGKTTAFVPAVTGPTGSQGGVGATGPQGLQGLQGVPGDPGVPASISNYSYQIHFTGNNGSFRVPVGLTVMVISAMGGGGGGSNGLDFEGGSATAGDVGCPARGWRSRVNVVPGTIITWTIGLGGAGGQTSGGIGLNGGDTVVNIPGVGTLVSPGGQGQGGAACAAWTPPFSGVMYPVELAAMGYGAGGASFSPLNGGGQPGTNGAVYLEWIQINDSAQAVIT